ncbi:hypothetical protein [Actinomadura sp. B10D3]|uniref:hypothetical protein n=1 Tax=Actinomadura sp. B10D3 TaxID=3153557 RepID=UPI00325EDBF0
MTRGKEATHEPGPGGTCGRRFHQQIIQGVVIVLAVAVDRLRVREAPAPGAAA